jgi:uncharacterized protein (TIGR03118 family)
VANATADFVIREGGRSAPAAVLFSTEDGTIAGFNSAVDPSQAIIAADQSGNGAVYKLLAMGQAGGANYLYATNFHNGTVDVFDKNFARHTFFASQFTDPNTPAGFAPFGIKNINGILFVTYAKQKPPDNHDDQEGPGNGFIDEFDTSGHFLKRFASGTAAGGTLTALNSPIGMTIAPAGFGKFGGDLLVGNFGDSHVSAFNLKTGRFLGQLEGTNGQPLVLNGGVNSPPHDTKGLWGIAFGNGQGGAGKQTLFFASGPNDETDGVFGMVKMADGHRDGDDRDDGGNGRHVATPTATSLTAGDLIVDELFSRMQAVAGPQGSQASDGGGTAAGTHDDGSTTTPSVLPAVFGQGTARTSEMHSSAQGSGHSVQELTKLALLDVNPDLFG